MDWPVIISILIVVGLAFVLWRVAENPSEGVELQSEGIATRHWRCPKCDAVNLLDVHECACGHELSAVIQPETSEDTAGAKWRIWGILFALCGAGGVVYSFFMSTTVETYIPTSILSADETSQVVNLGLLFDKGSVIVFGLFGFGLGVFCIAVGSILDAIQRKSEV